jgi:serine/threonine protein kinase
MLQEKSKEIHLIGQGSYGCIFYPGIKCGRKQPNDPIQIVTKIQEASNSTLDELEIGKIVQTIPRYQQFFAPIIENCNINLSMINNKEIEKCEIKVKEKNKKFLSNKIAYAGKLTMGKYINKKMDNIRKKYVTLKKGSLTVTKQIDLLKKFLIKIISSHIYLSESILLLQQKNIIHFDLKENNIIYDEKRDVPVIIDFGLSINMNKLKTVKDFKTEFNYSNFETCIQWPIEPILLIYICKNIILPTDKNFISLDQKITSTTLVKESIKKFLIDESSDGRHVGISEELKKRFEVKILHYVNSFIGKTWKELWDSLLNSKNTWDTYSLAQLFHYELYKLQLINDKLVKYFIGSYSTLLIRIITSEPTKRPDLSSLIEQMKQIIKNIKKNDADTLIKLVRPIIQSENYSESINRIQTHHEYNEELLEKIIGKNQVNKL